MLREYVSLVSRMEEVKRSIHQINGGRISLTELSESVSSRQLWERACWYGQPTRESRLLSY
jgi:hypothetical protein